MSASVRNQVVVRLVRMNLRHAAHAWEHRRDRPVAPHAVCFLYVDRRPAEAQGEFLEVVAATRMFNDDPTVQDLPRLLHRLTVLARDRYAGTPGGFDPAVQMTGHHDQSSGAATYIGLGVSTLDTPAGGWAQMQQAATGPEDIAGRCLALLTDHTAMVLDRGASRDAFGAVSVHSTTDLNVAPGLAGRAWIHHRDVSTMPASADVWDRLHELHMVTVNQPHRPTL